MNLVKASCKDRLKNPNLISTVLYNSDRLTTAFDRFNTVKGNTRVELASLTEQCFDRQGSTKPSHKIRPLAHYYPL